MLAAGNGSAEVVGALLKGGGEVNAKNSDGMTALMNAAAAGEDDIVRLLLDAGADINARDKEGHSALWHARENDSGDDLIQLLLARGAYEDPPEPKPEG